ncbi:MAG: hypothetical protein V2I33_25365 [Kangiellaceae bacterium]|jgi:chromosome segregation ATPase|nr:hypothetical protein [Kangiellaceae bacterium]
MVQREHSVISDELARRLEEVRALDATRLSLEREVAELRPLRAQLQDALDELARVKGTSAEKEHEFTRRIRGMEELESQTKALTVENANLNTTISNLTNEKAML